MTVTDTAASLSGVSFEKYCLETLIKLNLVPRPATLRLAYKGIIGKRFLYESDRSGERLPHEIITVAGGVIAGMEFIGNLESGARPILRLYANGGRIFMLEWDDTDARWTAHARAKQDQYVDSSGQLTVFD
ncbi:MAG: hypothetical protein AAB892_01275 [Patescibacteria group bacterium]